MKLTLFTHISKTIVTTPNNSTEEGSMFTGQTQIFVLKTGQMIYNVNNNKKEKKITKKK